MHTVVHNNSLVHSDLSSLFTDVILDVKEGNAANVTKNTKATDKPSLAI